jgi:hypothetical protein
VQAACCTCALVAGHPGPHECVSEDCAGQWTFDADGRLLVIRLPKLPAWLEGAALSFVPRRS